MRKLIDFLRKLFGVRPKKKKTASANPGPSEYHELHRQKNPNFYNNPLGGVAVDIAEWALKTLVNTFGSKSAGMLFDALFASKESSEINKVIDRLDAIEDMLKQLTQLYRNTTYEYYINQRSSLISDLHTAQRECLTRLKTEYDKPAAERDGEKIKALVNEWANQYVSGNRAANQFKNVINFIVNSRIEQTTLYDVYDAYVYNTTPWEHQGYEFRESLRNLDMSVITVNALLAAMYYNLKEDITDAERESLVKDIHREYGRYADYFKAHKVERRDDTAVCQIQGLHFKMPRNIELRDYKNQWWFANGREWTGNSTFEIVYGPDAGKYYNGNLTQDEFDALKKFYAGKYNSMLEILRNEARITNNPEFDGHCVLLLQSGTYQIPVSGNYNCYASGLVKAANLKGTNTGIFTIGWAKTEETGILFWTKRIFKGWGTDADIPSDQLHHYGEVGGKWYSLNLTRY